MRSPMAEKKPFFQMEPMAPFIRAMPRSLTLTLRLFKRSRFAMADRPPAAPVSSQFTRPPPSFALPAALLA